jgi:hypothetical protein
MPAGSTRAWSLLLAAWTVLVWTTRINNIWADDELSTGEQWASTALAGSFTVLALAAVIGVLRRTTWAARAVTLLAGWTILVWIVRGIGIATGDHDAAFVAVHLVLAGVSVVLALVALRALHWREGGGLSPVSGSGRARG